MYSKCQKCLSLIIALESKHQKWFCSLVEVVGKSSLVLSWYFYYSVWLQATKIQLRSENGWKDVQEVLFLWYLSEFIAREKPTSIVYIACSWAQTIVYTLYMYIHTYTLTHTACRNALALDDIAENSDWVTSCTSWTVQECVYEILLLFPTFIWSCSSNWLITDERRCGASMRTWVTVQVFRFLLMLCGRFRAGQEWVEAQAAATW